MNSRTPFVLLLTCAVVAGGYLWWRSRPLPTPPAPPTPAATPLLAATLGAETEIVALEVTIGSAAPLRFTRDAGSTPWTVVAPVSCNAADWVVNDLILALKGLQQRSTLTVADDDGVALQRLELGTVPRAIIRVTPAGGDPIVIDIGTALVAGSGTHIRVSGSNTTVYIVDYDFKGILERTAADYCDRQLLRFAADQITALEVDDGTTGRAYHIARSTEDTWRFTAPFDAAAQTATLNTVLSTIERLWVRAWVTLPDASAFGPPALRIALTGTATTDPSAVHCLEFSAQGPPGDAAVRYVRECGGRQVGITDLHTVQACTPDLARWRDPALGSGATWTPRRIEVQRAADTVVLTFDDNGWHLLDDTPADPQAVDALIATVRNLQAVSFLEGRAGPACGLDPAATHVVLIDAEGATTEQLAIGHHTEQVERRLRYVRRGDTIAKVRSEDVDIAFAELGVLADRRVILRPADLLQELVITRRVPHAMEPQTLTLARGDDGRWQMVAPVRQAVDAVAAHRMASALAPLRAGRRLGPGRLADAVFDRADAEVRWTFAAPDGDPSGGSSTTVRVVRQQDVLLARRMGDGALFELQPDTAIDLTAEVLPTTLWTYTPDAVRAVRWTRPAGTIALVLDANGWRCEQEPDLPIAAERVRGHLTDLLATRAPRFVDYRTASDTPYTFDPFGQRFEIESLDGSVQRVTLSEQPCAGDARLFYATRTGVPGVFLVGQSFLERAALRLERFEP